jgi:hypothetical protein
MADSSFISPSTKNAATKRNIKQVPFVELFNHRLQGVVSSGSDIERVYVSFFEAGTLDYYCSTNNNRPCGGLRGSPCNHLQAVMIEAIAAYGLDQVTNYLKIPGDVSHIHSAFDIMRCRKKRACKRSFQPLFKLPALSRTRNLKFSLTRNELVCLRSFVICHLSFVTCTERLALSEV